MARKRGGPAGLIFTIIFMTPFIAAGLFTAYSGVAGTATNSALFTVPFGLVFAGIGVWQIVRTVREMRSPESQALKQPTSSLALSDVLPQGVVANYRTAGRRAPLTAGELYGPVLTTAPLPRLRTKPGVSLPVGLEMTEVKASNTYFMLGFSIIWSLFTVPFFIGFLHTPSVAVIIPLIFLAIGVTLFIFSIRKLLGRLKLPRVELSQEPIFLGEDLHIHVEQHGPARVMRLRVEMLCREHVTYTVGTDTRTEDHDVLSKELLDSGGEMLKAGQSWPNKLSVTIPADAPPTFRAPNNVVAWLIRVRAEIAGWPDYDELYELRVLPRPPT